MTGKTEARELLLDLIGVTDAVDRGTTPAQAIDDAIAEAILNQPSLRHCLVPGCMREFDAMSCMAGDPPPRPSWDGKGWATLGAGSIFPAGGHICPDHKQTVTDHWPRRLKLPSGRCARIRTGRRPMACSTGGCTAACGAGHSDHDRG